MKRALCAFPAVVSLRLHAVRAPNSTEPRRITLSCAIPFSPRVTDIAIVGTGITDPEPLLTVASACPRLERLSMSNSDPISDSDVRRGVSALRRTLHSLDLSGDPDGSCGAWRINLTDVFGSTLSSVANLTHLDLSGCTKLGHTTFRAITRLQRITTLALKGTRIEDAEVEAITDSLPSLRLLDLTECEHIGPRVMSFIPPQLRVLKVSLTAALCDSMPAYDPNPFPPARQTHRNAKPLANLEELHGSLAARLQTWRPLLSLAACLVLKLDGSVLAGAGLTDEAVGDALGPLSRLRCLEVGFSHVGDATARAAAALPHLEELGMFNTMVGFSGVQSLANGAARKSLLLLDLRSCAAIARVDEAQVLLDSSLSRRGVEVRI